MMKPRIWTYITLTFWCATTYGQSNYYDNVADLEGSELRTGLHQLIKGHKSYSYDEVKDLLRDLDEDPENSDNVILFYTRRSQSKTDFASNNQPDFWNREHVWPKSHGFPEELDTAYTDVHHLRPADATVNTSKSNKDFNNVEHLQENEEGEADNTYTDEDYWEPADVVKGDVARMMFYMAVRYEGEIDLELVDRFSLSNEPELGVLYTLIQWHHLDPVSDEEKARNEKVFGYQENRNPFVDHPEWVESIWGNDSDPFLAVDDLSFNSDFGQVRNGEELVQQYTLNAYKSSEAITVSTGGAFSLSLDGTNWSQSLLVTNASEDFQTAIYIAFRPTEDDASYSSVVNHVIGQQNVELTVNGQEGGIDLMSIAEARSKELEEQVYVTGVVIDAGNNSSNNRVIYDGTAGIVIRSFDAGNESASFKLGDSISVTGGLSDYNNLLQIGASPITIKLLAEDAQQPEPKEVTLEQIDESLESQLVYVKNVAMLSQGEFQGGGAEGSLLIVDETRSGILRIGSSSHPLVGTPVPNTRFDLTGIVGQFRDEYQISPRYVDDIELIILSVSDKFDDVVVYPNPTADVVKVNRQFSGYKLLSASGRLVEEGAISHGEISLVDQKPGVYLLQLRGEAKASIRVIKK